MKHTILPLAIVATAVLTACNNNSSPGAKTSAPVNITVPTNTSPEQQKGQFTYNPTTTTPATTTQPVVTTKQPVVTTAPTVTPTTTTKAGLNPEHGQPGHRCDLAVGAPLDSKPATTPVITSTSNNTASRTQPADAQKTFSFNPTTTPTNTQTVTIPNPTSTTKAGMNPEHGQPGHRCDIAVGAPLDSKPTTPAVTTTSTNTTPTNTNTTTSVPQFTPVLNTETKPAVKTDAAVTTGVGLNPEHGKPGHRCDIAVGAPLDSKPAAVTVEKKN